MLPDGTVCDRALSFVLTTWSLVLGWSFELTAALLFLLGGKTGTNLNGCVFTLTGFAIDLSVVCVIVDDCLLVWLTVRFVAWPFCLFVTSPNKPLSKELFVIWIEDFFLIVESRNKPSDVSTDNRFYVWRDSRLPRLLCSGIFSLETGLIDPSLLNTETLDE